MAEANSKTVIDAQLKCNGYLNCKVEYRDGRLVNLKKWGLYWVKLNKNRLEFYTVEWMDGGNPSHPPPRDAIDPDQHKHIVESLCFQLTTSYLVDRLPTHKTRKNVFYLLLPHICDGNCKKKCSKKDVTHKVLFEAPNDQRCHEWASSLRSVITKEGEMPIKSIESRLLSTSRDKKPRLTPTRSISLAAVAKLPDCAQGERDLEILKDRLAQCRLTEEHLNYMYSAVQRAEEIAHIFHYFDKSKGCYEMVHGLRQPLLTALTKDYYLYPGADWSKITRGEQVYVIGCHHGNMYYVMTARPHVCCQGLPAKWDSGFLSVAVSQKSGTSDSSESLASSDTNEDKQDTDIFDMEQDSSRRYTWPMHVDTPPVVRTLPAHGESRPFSFAIPEEGVPPGSLPDHNDQLATPTVDACSDEVLAKGASTECIPNESARPEGTHPPTGDTPPGDTPPSIAVTGDMSTVNEALLNTSCEGATTKPKPVPPPSLSLSPGQDTAPRRAVPAAMSCQDPPSDLPVLVVGSSKMQRSLGTSPVDGNYFPGSSYNSSMLPGSPPEPNSLGSAFVTRGVPFMETVLFGFVAGSVLEAFNQTASDDCPGSGDSLLEEGGVSQEGRGGPQARGGGSKRWSLQNFKDLWKKEDDSVSDAGNVSLGTPSSSISFMIDAHSPEPDQSSSTSSLPNSMPLSPSSGSLSRSHSNSKSGRFTLRKSKTKGSSDLEVSRLPYLWRPQFGMEREVYIDPGEPETDVLTSFGFKLASFDPRGRSVTHVFLTNVQDDSKAFRCGVRQGDALLRIDGVDVTAKSEDDITEHLGKAQGAAKLEKRNIHLTVVWRDGDGLISKSSLREEQVLKLQEKQDKLKDLLEKEAQILGRVLSEPAARDEEREESDGGESGGGCVQIECLSLNSLRADYLVLPMPTCIHIDPKTRLDPLWQGVLDVRTAGGRGLEVELAMKAPPTWGGHILTGGHQLGVKGVLHIPVGYSHEALDISCTQVLQSIAEQDRTRTVIMGFHKEHLRVVMAAVLKHLNSATDRQGSRIVFAPQNESDLEDYRTCLSLAEEKLVKPVQDRKYSNFMDGVVMTAMQDKLSTSSQGH